MEILILVLALVTLDIVAQRYGADSRQAEPDRNTRRLGDLRPR